MPAQQRLGLDEEAGPAGSGQHAADLFEQGAVGGLELGSLGLAAEHGELVAQDQPGQHRPVGPVNAWPGHLAA
jgi:hypothetical protein